MSRHLVIAASRMAIGLRQPAEGLVHHSDRGAQYTSDDFLAELKENGIQSSMSGSGCCYDNAVVESFFGVLKWERVNRVSYRTRTEARSDVFESIEVFYNRKRRHGYRVISAPQRSKSGQADSMKPSIKPGQDHTAVFRSSRNCFILTSATGQNLLFTRP